MKLLWATIVPYLREYLFTCYVSKFVWSVVFFYQMFLAGMVLKNTLFCIYIV